MQSDHIQTLRNLLEEYIRRRPNAADTVEGIMQWWLREESRTSTRSDVERALALLCEEGTLERTGRIYRSAHTRGRH